MDKTREEIKDAYRDYPDHTLQSAIDLARRSGSSAPPHVRKERRAVAEACQELLDERKANA